MSPEIAVNVGRSTVAKWFAVCLAAVRSIFLNMPATNTLHKNPQLPHYNKFIIIDLYSQNEKGIDFFGKIKTMAKISPKSFYKINQRKVLIEKIVKELSTVENENLESRSELLNTLLGNQGFYGFGDSQYERIISTLRPLIGSFNPLRLTKKGREVISNRMNYYSQIRDSQQYLGGSLKYNFLYNSDTKRILKL